MTIKTDIAGNGNTKKEFTAKHIGSSINYIMGEPRDTIDYEIVEVSGTLTPIATTLQ